MKIAWLFPGQGAQFVGMGRDVTQASKAAHRVFERANAALDAVLSKPLSSLCFDGPEEDLTQTAHTQPAILTTSIAVLSALQERWPSLPMPIAMAGHSLGESTAFVAAGSLRLEDACRFIHVRGKAMQNAVPLGQGAMTAVIQLKASLLEELCHEASRRTNQLVSIANYNAPHQIVLAGTVQAIAKVEELVAQHKGKAIRLKVSAPFHCALMQPAVMPVTQALESISIQTPSCVVLANVDAQPKNSAVEIREALIQQVGACVQWQASIEAMVAMGVTHALEIGPGRVLQGLVKRIAPSIQVTSLCDWASIEAAGAIFQS